MQNVRKLFGTSRHVLTAICILWLSACRTPRTAQPVGCEAILNCPGSFTTRLLERRIPAFGAGVKY
jgi:hypothetical protein